MKNSLHAAALMSGLLFAAAASAQGNAHTTDPVSRPESATAQRAPHAAMIWRDLDVDRMTKELGLSTDQTDRLREIDQRYAKSHDELKTKEQTMGREENMKMEAAMLREREVQVKSVLTAEQYNKWDRGRSAMRAEAASGSSVHGKADASAPKAKATVR
ncbi:MAG: hypothetical protein H6594_01595 [Flavobacteriales bacterium]|nr:hypothetical protein [Flavobacteriales bacterium]